jgi:hypothetical protein
MGNSTRDEPQPQTFGLPASLHVPVAARDVEAVADQVGVLIAQLRGRDGRANALKVRTRRIPVNSDDASLWRQPEAPAYRAALYPEYQLWVHVDYWGYRGAWVRLGMPELAPGIVLDHVANRRATRERGMLHPLIRLCPVSAATNSNAGHRQGSEGLETEWMRKLRSLPEDQRESWTKNFATPIVYADPADLTKMLDVAPGTDTLDGVRDFQAFFYSP